MRNSPAYLFPLLLSLSPCIHAGHFTGATQLSHTTKEHINITGPAQLSEVSAHFLKVTGPLKFQDLEIENKAVITGPMSGEKGKFNNLVVTGPMDVTKILCNKIVITGSAMVSDMIVKGDFKIIGYLRSLDSEFHNIIITSNKVSLKNSTVNNIEMKKINDSEEAQEQVIVLHGSTIVKGNITFESGNGKVLLDDTAKIEGSVEGGGIIQR